MPKKPTQISPVEIKPAWDLSDKLVREKLRKFQDELTAITHSDPATRGHEFDFWCLKKGYIVNGRIETVFSRTLNREYKRVAYSRVTIDYAHMVEMYKALGLLLERQEYARLQEHLRDLAGAKCSVKSKPRCMFCHPMMAREVLANFRL